MNIATTVESRSINFKFACRRRKVLTLLLKREEGV